MPLIWAGAFLRASVKAGATRPKPGSRNRRPSGCRLKWKTLRGKGPGCYRQPKRPRCDDQLGTRSSGETVQQIATHYNVGGAVQSRIGHRAWIICPIDP